MMGTPVGLAVNDLASGGTPGRVALGLARRLLAFGIEPRLAVHRVGTVDLNTPDGRPLDVETVGEWPFFSWLRAYSFDRAARRRLADRQVQLIHGHGDLIAQDVLSVYFCEKTRQRRVPGAPAIPAGIGYLRRFQFGPGGARVILAPSEMVRGDLAEGYDADPAAVRVLTPGVDLRRFSMEDRGQNRFTLNRATGWTDQHKVILAVVTDDPATQNLRLLAEAVDRLAGRTPAAFCLIGPVDLGKDPAVQRLAAAGRFFQVPMTHHVEKYFSAADVYVLPAHYEEFGLTVLDALASGTPAVVSGRTGAREVLAPGVNGNLVEDLGDPAALADVVEKTWALDRAACRRSVEGRTWEVYAQAVAAIYQSLM